jgi:hypothetical protein
MPDRRVCAFGARLTKVNVYNPRRGVLSKLPDSPYPDPKTGLSSPQRCLTTSSPKCLLRPARMSPKGEFKIGGESPHVSCVRSSCPYPQLVEM